jgi:hypothetical protein
VLPTPAAEGLVGTRRVERPHQRRTRPDG